MANGSITGIEEQVGAKVKQIKVGAFNVGGTGAGRHLAAGLRDNNSVFKLRAPFTVLGH